MAPSSPHQLRTALRSAMTRAMKQRDREATAVFRAAVSAIDNAEAVAVSDAPRAGAVESAPIGVGRTDVPRRELSERDVIAIVEGEVHERRAAAEQFEAAHPQEAARLRRGADLLSTLIHGPAED